MNHSSLIPTCFEALKQRRTNLVIFSITAIIRPPATTYSTARPPLQPLSCSLVAALLLIHCNLGQGTRHLPASKQVVASACRAG